MEVRYDALGDGGSLGAQAERGLGVSGNGSSEAAKRDEFPTRAPRGLLSTKKTRLGDSLTSLALCKCESELERVPLHSQPWVIDSECSLLKRNECPRGVAKVA